MSAGNRTEADFVEAFGSDITWDISYVRNLELNRSYDFQML